MDSGWEANGFAVYQNQIKAANMETMKGPHKYIWQQFETNFIKAHFYTLTNRQLANMLGHKLTLLRTRCYEMGLKRIELEYWTDEQVAFLKENYKRYGDTELAQMFGEVWHKEKGWDKKHIEKKRRYLNLKRTKAEKDAIRESHKAAGVYKLGSKHTWDNRGRAAIGEKRMWKDRNGYQFMVIKTATGFVHYAPYLWSQLHGEIPEGHVVRLKDGNAANVVAENLELITMAENARRNSIHRYPKEIKDLIYLSNKLDRTIKKLENEKQDK